MTTTTTTRDVRYRDTREGRCGHTIELVVVRIDGRDVKLRLCPTCDGVVVRS